MQTVRFAMLLDYNRSIVRPGQNAPLAERGLETGIVGGGFLLTDARAAAPAQMVSKTCISGLLKPKKLGTQTVPPGGAARIVPEAFGPITDAEAKGYRYQIAHGCRNDVPRPLFDRHFVFWTAYDLDPLRMHEAARHIVGEHDFTSFTRLHHGRESTVRTVFDCAVHATSEHRCEITISGNGFLYNMVRIIAGTLVEVGRGEIAPDDIPAIIAARDRTKAGPTLPPEGLCLMWIRYPDRVLGC